MSPVWLENIEWISKFLSSHQIEKLETLRDEYGIPHEFFSVGVSSSPELGKLIVIRDYYDYRKMAPHSSEEQIFTSLLIHENKHIKISGSKNIMTDEQIKKAASDMNTLDELCEFIANLDSQENSHINHHEISIKIEQIIQER